VTRVPQSGHEGDHSAALEEAEDALAGTTYDGLDLLLRGRGRRVEHVTLAIAVWRVDAVEKSGVKVRVEPEVAVGALDDRHGAGIASRQAAVGVATAVPSSNGVGEDAHHLTQQFSVEREREAQRERHGQHKLSDRHIRQDVVHKVQRPRAHPPAETAWAHRTCLARKRHDMMLAANIAEKVGETSPQDST